MHVEVVNLLNLVARQTPGSINNVTRSQLFFAHQSARMARCPEISCHRPKGHRLTRGGVELEVTWDLAGTANAVAHH